MLLLLCGFLEQKSAFCLSYRGKEICRGLHGSVYCRKQPRVSCGGKVWRAGVQAGQYGLNVLGNSGALLILFY